MTQLVSIYIPTHNRRKLLERALKSVLAQTYKHIEVIVVDDGSTDDTEAFMKDFIGSHPQIRYLKHNAPKGANAARNYAIREARGYFVAGLDDDDEFCSTRIEKLIKVYKRDYAFVFSKMIKKLPNGKKIISGTKKEYIAQYDILFGNIVGSQVLAPKEIFIAAGLFDETLVSSQDYDMWIRMLFIKPIAKAVLEPLYIVHEHDEIRITTSKKQFSGYFNCYKKHKGVMLIEHRQELLKRLRLVKGKHNNSLKMIRTLYTPKKALKEIISYIKRGLIL